MHVKDCVGRQQTSAEGKYTQGLQPALQNDQLVANKANPEFDVSVFLVWHQPSRLMIISCLCVRSLQGGTAKGWK